MCERNSKPMCTDVVIVTHNSGHLLIKAVASAVEQAGAEHVWVMDAESIDGSVETICAEGTSLDNSAGGQAVHVMPVPNRGFAASCNRGIQSTHAPFVLLLNPDAFLMPGALVALLEAAVSRPRAGIVGALVIDQKGRVQAGSYGHFPSLASAVGLHLWRSWQRLRGNTTLSPRPPRATAQVDWVTGAAMLVRRAAIEEVGSLDEGFFLYYEDIDWCWRMRARGWEVLLEPTAMVVHHVGGSSAPKDAVAKAYRESFSRYCDLRRLWGLGAASRAGLTLRKLMGGSG
jgi:N-acetylglucosaminyl-diphospho-decaprenol L-rhamnosyltransferase